MGLKSPCIQFDACDVTRLKCRYTLRRRKSQRRAKLPHSFGRGTNQWDKKVKQVTAPWGRTCHTLEGRRRRQKWINAGCCLWTHEISVKVRPDRSAAQRNKNIRDVPCVSWTTVQFEWELVELMQNVWEKASAPNEKLNYSPYVNILET